MRVSKRKRAIGVYRDREGKAMLMMAIGRYLRSYRDTGLLNSTRAKNSISECRKLKAVKMSTVKVCTIGSLTFVALLVSHFRCRNIVA